MNRATFATPEENLPGLYLFAVKETVTTEKKRETVKIKIDSFDDIADILEELDNHELFDRENKDCLENPENPANHRCKNSCGKECKSCREHGCNNRCKHGCKHTHEHTHEINRRTRA